MLKISIPVGPIVTGVAGVMVLLSIATFVIFITSPAVVHWAFLIPICLGAVMGWGAICLLGYLSSPLRDEGD